MILSFRSPRCIKEKECPGERGRGSGHDQRLDCCNDVVCWLAREAMSSSLSSSGMASTVLSLSPRLPRRKQCAHRSPARCQRSQPSPGTQWLTWYGYSCILLSSLTGSCGSPTPFLFETVQRRSVHCWCTFSDGSVVEVFHGALVRSRRLLSDFEIYGCSTCRFAGGSSSSLVSVLLLNFVRVFNAVSLLHHLLRSSLTCPGGFGLRESGLMILKSPLDSCTVLASPEEYENLDFSGCDSRGV